MKMSIFMFFNSILRHKFLLPFVTVFRTLPFCQPVARLLANTFMPAQILPVCLLYAYFLALTHDSSCLIMEITKKMTFTRLIWGKVCLKECHQSYMPLLSHIELRIQVSLHFCPAFCFYRIEQNTFYCHNTPFYAYEMKSNSFFSANVCKYKHTYIYTT